MDLGNIAKIAKSLLQILANASDALVNSHTDRDSRKCPCSSIIIAIIRPLFISVPATPPAPKTTPNLKSSWSSPPHKHYSTTPVLPHHTSSNHKRLNEKRYPTTTYKTKQTKNTALLPSSETFSSFMLMGGQRGPTP